MQSMPGKYTERYTKCEEQHLLRFVTVKLNNICHTLSLSIPLTLSHFYNCTAFLFFLGCKNLDVLAYCSEAIPRLCPERECLIPIPHGWIPKLSCHTFCTKQKGRKCSGIPRIHTHYHVLISFASNSKYKVHYVSWGEGNFTVSG